MRLERDDSTLVVEVDGDGIVDVIARWQERWAEDFAAYDARCRHISEVGDDPSVGPDAMRWTPDEGGAE